MSTIVIALLLWALVVALVLQFELGPPRRWSLRRARGDHRGSAPRRADPRRTA